jgi:hypothetical protein
MVLKYHDKNELMDEVHRENEILWISSIIKYKKDGEPFDLDTIQELISSIQEYFSLAEQEVWIIRKRCLRNALDDLSRLTYCLVNLLKTQIELKSKEQTEVKLKLGFQQNYKEALKYMTKLLVNVLYGIDIDMVGLNFNKIIDSYKNYKLNKPKSIEEYIKTTIEYLGYTDNDIINFLEIDSTELDQLLKGNIENIDSKKVDEFCELLDINRNKIDNNKKRFR